MTNIFFRNYNIQNSKVKKLYNNKYIEIISKIENAFKSQILHIGHLHVIINNIRNVSFYLFRCFI